MAAKIAWLERHEPERIKAARWLLTPRDLMAWRLTGEVATDHTMASASGLFEISGHRVPAPSPLGDEEGSARSSPVSSTTSVTGSPTPDRRTPSSAASSVARPASSD